MWEERFAASEGYLFGRDPAFVLLENPWIVPPSGAALSVADGEGRNAVHLARAGLDVTTFDMSATAVSRAQKLAEEAGVTLETHVSDWSGWTWPEAQFDLVCGIFIQFEGPDGRRRQFADMARSLRPGGRIVLHGYRPEQIEYGTGGPPHRENMYTPDILTEAFAGWRVERLAEYDRPQRSGSAHVGMAALIDFVAQKPEG